ncbi:MAG: asparagine synthetase B, partial [Planctomycetota bacterium]
MARMCGIGGVVCWRADTRADASVARTLVRWLRHRGPDGEGTYVGRARGLAPGGAEARVACAHTRLAVIDPRPVAQGPLASDDGRILLLFNGEIYNHRSLRSGLERRGHRFRSRCDAEVVLRAYEEAGPACVAWFEGMYAFAVLDRRRGRLVLARDPAGEKPLFVAQPPGGFVFASEIAAIVAAAHAAGLALDRTLCRAWVPLQRALGFVPAPHTLLRGVESLRPGEVRLLEAGRLRVQRRLVFGRFAPAPFGESGPGADPAERAASRPRSVLVRLRRAVERAVRARLESDVPLGGFLSGGIDSALVCALARRALGRLETFTLGFDEPGWDERAAAAATARAIGAVHHDSRVGAEALERIEAIVLRHGAPFGD